MSYDEKINRVCDYISQNLDEPLTLDRLSDIAALSKFHFHRVFSIYTGLSLLKFIQMARLKRASFQLAFKQEAKVIDIALDAGFDSPEAFSRAFKRTFGQTPTEFRKKPEWSVWHSKYQFKFPKGENVMDVKIIDLEKMKVAMIEHRGSPERIFETTAKFINWRKTTGLSPVKSSRNFGIAYDDPQLTPPAEFRFDFCGSIDRDVPQNTDGIKTSFIPSGRYAVVRHKGSLDNIADSVYYLYRQWLPQSGEELRDYPCMFEYLNLIPDVDECDLLTDVYIPLK